MLATPARELPADEGSWAAEFKWDGLRAVAYVSGGALLLRSRLDRDITATYPDLAGVVRFQQRRQSGLQPPEYLRVGPVKFQQPQDGQCLNHVAKRTGFENQNFQMKNSK